MTVRFYIGDARSGKSAYAEQQAGKLTRAALQKGEKAVLHYIATATAFDAEMRDRIRHHQERRGTEWVNHECPLELADLLPQFGRQDVVLIDCLTLWLNNVIYNEGETAGRDLIQRRIDELTAALDSSPATILCVSNEVGLGVVPMGEISRLFVDYAGWMNQAIARIAGSVTFMAAGLPLPLKESV